MSIGPRQATINGERVTVIYLDQDFNPVEPDVATLVKIIHADGRRTFATLEPKPEPNVVQATIV